MKEVIDDCVTVGILYEIPSYEFKNILLIVPSNGQYSQNFARPYWGLMMVSNN